jgi:hypothetical protein
VLLFIEESMNKVLTQGWLNLFASRHQREMLDMAIHPHENPRRQVPRKFMEDYLALITAHVSGVEAELVFNIDEARKNDWVERRASMPTFPLIKLIL